MYSKIKDIARNKNAIILAHNYQPAEIQHIADICGDSLELAFKAAETNADMIVFCGVHFMAESAKIIAPRKKVVLPVLGAGCAMADMADPAKIMDMRSQYPDAAVVTYINSTAAVKAVSDVVCTSSNAIQIVNRLEQKQIIFVPDQNLGSWVARHTTKELILYDGYCPVHHQIARDKVLSLKQAHPDAPVVAHPECPAAILDLADEVCSTSGMIRFAREHHSRKFVIITEDGMLYRLRQDVPEKEFVGLGDSCVCPDMKKITIDNLYTALETGKPEITLDSETETCARRALQKMLELSK